MIDRADLDERRELLRGAGLAGLSRLGAVVEIASQALFIWLVGVPAFGLYASLWAAVVLASTVVDFAMTNALQRLLPQLDEGPAHAAVKLAVAMTVGGAILMAIAVALGAEAVAAQFSAAQDDRSSLPLAVRAFVWALPMWMFVEIATAAVRARRAFGPEIRIRIFWEQCARMAFALIFFFAGFGEFSLIAGHLASLALTVGLSILLLGRYFNLSRLIREPIDLELGRQLSLTGAALFPSNLARRSLIHGPALALNFLLPGRHGAEAAGLFEVARRIATVPYFVRQSFEYVLAPLSSSSARVNVAEVLRLYHLATRMISALVLPLSAFLIFSARDILSIFRPEVVATLPVLVILVAGRTFDAIAGPAQTIVEMTGNRILPLINSLVGVAAWIALVFWLVPDSGGIGMAVAVAVATTITAWVAVLELRPWGPTKEMVPVWIGAAITSGATGLMATVHETVSGPWRFAALTVLWLGTTWLTMRWGLVEDDKKSLGRVATQLKLL